MENEIKKNQLQKQLNDLKSTFTAKSTEVTAKPSTSHKKAGKKVSNKPAATSKDSLIKESHLKKNDISKEEQPDDTEHAKIDAARSAFINVSYEQEKAHITDNVQRTFYYNFNHQNQEISLDDNADMLDVSDKDKIDDPAIDENNLVVLEVDTIDRKSNLEFFLMNTLTNMSKDIAAIKTTQEQIVTFLLDKKVTKMNDVAIDFKTKFNLSFPITLMEQFLSFDSELEKNKLLKNYVSIQVMDLYDSDLIVTKSLTRMLKFFMAKEVAEKLTAVRSARSQSEERTQRFVSTNLYGIMCGIIKIKRTKKLLEINDKMFLKCISEVLCNVKQWK